jgi:hypothetical protein
MKRIIAVTLVVALIAPALPAFAADGTPESTGTAYAARQSVRPAISLRESAKEAVAVDAASYGPRSLPRQGSDGVRNQMGGGGGGHAGMIIGLVSAAVGIAATVYMVKYMKKTTDAATKAPGQ